MATTATVPTKPAAHPSQSSRFTKGAARTRETIEIRKIAKFREITGAAMPGFYQLGWSSAGSRSWFSHNHGSHGQHGCGSEASRILLSVGSVSSVVLASGVLGDLRLLLCPNRFDHIRKSSAMRKAVTYGEQAISLYHGKVSQSTWRPSIRIPRKRRTVVAAEKKLDRTELSRCNISDRFPL